MKTWTQGEVCQVRDRRDNSVIFTAKVREQKTEPPFFEGERDRVVVYLDPIDDGFPPCGIPHICVEPVGQKVRNS